MNRGTTSAGGGKSAQTSSNANKKAINNAVTSSLVKYDTPVLASNAGVARATQSQHQSQQSQQAQSPSKSTTKKQSQQQLPPVDTKQTTKQTEDILNSILPPREWTADGQLWVQYVSSTPATRLDVVNLQEQLDMKLQQRQARETGICPVREELYAQCFGTWVQFSFAMMCIDVIVSYSYSFDSLFWFPCLTR